MTYFVEPREFLTENHVTKIDVAAARSGSLVSGVAPHLWPPKIQGYMLYGALVGWNRSGFPSQVGNQIIDTVVYMRYLGIWFDQYLLSDVQVKETLRRPRSDSGP